MKRPHETLGLPMPVGRRLGEHGKLFWLAFFAIGIGLSAGVYIFQVNMSASKAYALRSLEKQADRLEEAVSALESRVAELQTLKALEARIEGKGFVPVGEVEFIQPPTGHITRR